MYLIVFRPNSKSIVIYIFLKDDRSKSICRTLLLTLLVAIRQKALSKSLGHVNECNGRDIIHSIIEAI